MHGRKGRNGSGKPKNQVFMQNRVFLVNLMNQLLVAASSMWSCVL